MSQRETSSVRRIGFTRLSPDSSQTRLPRVNIILVHGLRGHPQTTWEYRQRGAGSQDAEAPHRREPRDRLKAIFRHKHVTSTPASESENSTKTTAELSIENNVFWPRDYLVEDISEADVWTYGYNADVIEGLFEANNQNSVSQHGEDLAVRLDRTINNQMPIIFIAHSLGGVIVKDAICQSELCRSQTKLVVFLGTPHRGSAAAGWGVLASNLVRLAFQDSNKRILEALKPKSEVLDNIHKTFVKIADKASIKIHSFQEAKAILGVKGLDGKVVDDYSSRTGLPFEMVETIDANHMEMVRCKDKNDPQYQAIVEVLKHFICSNIPSGGRCESENLGRATQIETQRVLSSGETGVRRTPVNKSRYYLPLLENKSFTGRTAILDTLKERFSISKECQTIAVVGLGGVGKTQVALSLAYWVQDNQPDYSIFWVPALSDTSFNQAYTEMARQLNIETKDDEDLKVTVQKYLDSGEAGKWLLIVDNADEIDILLSSGGIDEFLPKSDKGIILFTTRSREVAVAVAGTDLIDVPEMSIEEATEFLGKILINKEQLRDQTTTEMLLRELTYLPLAISQAAAYMNQNQTPIRKYLGLLQNTEQDLVSLMSREFHDKWRYHGSRNAVAATWLVSFDQIRNSSSHAAQLLSFMSCIERKAIPQSILPKPPVEEEMEHAIGVLCGYAFLTRRGDDDMFDMHRLVHIATRVWMQKNNTTTETKANVIQHLASVFPTVYYPYTEDEVRSLAREYLPHAQHALQVSKEYQHIERFDLFFFVGVCLLDNRRFKEAVTALEEAVRWSQQYLAEDDTRLASEHALAIAYLDNRQIKEAINILEHVVAIDQKLLAEEEPERLFSEHELARAYLENRQIREAINILEHVVAVRRKMLVEEDHARLVSEQALASAYLDNRQTKEAIEILEHVVALDRKMLVEEDHARLSSEHTLASAYLNNRQIKETIQLLEHVVAVRRKVLIEEDHSRLVSEHILAVAYICDGRFGEAVPILEHVMTVRQSLVEEDRSRLFSEHTLADAYLRVGRVDEAVEILEHVVAIQKSFVEEDRNRLASEHMLADAYLRVGRVDEAVEILEHVVAVQKFFVEEDRNRLLSERMLAFAYIRDGRAGEAVPIVQHVVTVYKSLAEESNSRLASEHVVTVEKSLTEESNGRLASERTLAAAYIQVGRAGEAVPILEHIVAALKSLLVEEDYRRLLSENTLADAYIQVGRVGEAVPILEHVVAVKKTLDMSDEDRLVSQDLLTKAYDLLNRSESGPSEND